MFVFVFLVTISSQWYAWGPSQMHCKLCNNCWAYWKKYGGLKAPSRIGWYSYEKSKVRITNNCFFFSGENEVEPKKKSSGSISDEGGELNLQYN
jgi:metastasis-associated protein MTA